MATEFQKLVKKAQKAGELDFSADYTTFHKDGSITFKHTFFYRFGNNEEKYRNSVSLALSDAGIEHSVVDYGEAWNNWPKESYWYVKVDEPAKPSSSLVKVEDVYRTVSLSRQKGESITIGYYFGKIVNFQETYSGQTNKAVAGYAGVDVNLTLALLIECGWRII